MRVVAIRELPVSPFSGPDLFSQLERALVALFGRLGMTRTWPLAFIHPMVSYAKNGIFPFGIKCCILAPLTMGCINADIPTEEESYWAKT